MSLGQLGNIVELYKLQIDALYKASNFHDYQLRWENPSSFTDLLLVATVTLNAGLSQSVSCTDWSYMSFQVAKLIVQKKMFRGLEGGFTT